VDSHGAGFTSSIQISNGVVWVGYADEASGGIKVAHRALGANESPGETGSQTRNPQ
jgi:hypothetical protein